MKRSKFLSSLYKTLIYSDIFGSPLHKDELYTYLYKYKIEKKTFLKMLDSVPFLTCVNSVIALKGRESVLKNYNHRVKESDKKLKSISHILALLSRIPTIVLIGISGSVAAQNAKKEADVDLFIITRDHTLWITRFFVVCLLLFFNKKRKVNVKLAPDTICTNLWMSESHCSFLQENIFVAREIIQMKIVCNKEDMYHRFMQKNKWVLTYFPNFSYAQTSHSKHLFSSMWRLLSIFNLCMYGLQYVYMKNKITREKVSLHVAAFHPKDISDLILQMYKNRLKIYKYESKSWKDSISSHHYITPGS